ncbi:hypothetical protein B0H14DRAFT_2632366 [Mycena olivaceomarginata]|nr:hypothetical protein B0H14DRAFT_2632366 [Mycena olivaceomarginata]
MNAPHELVRSEDPLHHQVSPLSSSTNGCPLQQDHESPAAQLSLIPILWRRLRLVEKLQARRTYYKRRRLNCPTSITLGIVEVNDFLCFPHRVSRTDFYVSSFQSFMQMVFTRVSKSSKVDSPARRLSNLTGQGGTASGWSAWLNFGYIGSFPGIVRAASGALAVSFANITLQVFSIGENVLTVGMDHSDYDQAALSPPGILGAALLSMSNTTFTKWTIAGNAGTGESNIDAIRGVIAEGGLHAERLGWHLPGFDDLLWAAHSPSDGVNNGTIAFSEPLLNWMYRSVTMFL